MDTALIDPQIYSHGDAATGCVRRVHEFERAYRKSQEEEAIKDVFLRNCKKVCSKKAMKKSVLSNLPFIGTLRRYKPRYVPRDILAGVTVAIMHIPQSMAYAQLATLPPVCGLYMAFFSTLVYFFLGTSRHASPGAVAIVSLMVGSVADRSVANTEFPVSTPYNVTNGTDMVSDDVNHVDHRIAVAGAVSLVSGLIMIFLGKMGLGIVTTYMSESLVTGFTTGAAVHIFTSQLKNLLGLKTTPYHGPLNIVKTWIGYFKNITTINAASSITGVVCIVVLYIVKVHINQRFKSKLKIPIPIELIVLIVTTLISHFAYFKREFGVRVVGVVPTGMVTAQIPDVSLASNFIADAISMGIVAFAQSVSMCKIVARKNNYKVDSNQEMVAYGAGSVACSFFSSYVPAISITRTLVQEATGGVTLVAGLATCSVLIVVTVTAGPLFYSLPNCVLSAIVIANLRGMFRQFLELKPLWKSCKYDFGIWIVTFMAVVIINADLGLAVGILFSLITIVFRTQSASVASVGQVDGTDVYRSKRQYDGIEHRSSVCIVPYEAPLYFANAEIFVRKVYKVVGIDPVSRKKHKGDSSSNGILVSNSNHKAVEEQESRECQEMTHLQQNPETEVEPIEDRLRFVILDFACVSFMDLMGIKALKEVIKEYDSIDVTVYISGCRGNVLKTMESTKFRNEFDDRLFLTLKCASAHISDTS